MSLAAYQKQIDDIMQLPGRSYWQQLSQLAHLVEEVGELSRLLNHIYGDKQKKPEEARQEMAGELGDVLFAVVCLANKEGIDLDEAMRATIEKTLTRDKHRFEKKS